MTCSICHQTGHNKRTCDRHTIVATEGKYAGLNAIQIEAIFAERRRIEDEELNCLLATATAPAPAPATEETEDTDTESDCSDGRDRDDDEMSECEECGERFELGDFNCVESGMKQYCYCDDCFATKIKDGEVIKNPEDEDEWIFECDCCSACDYDNDDNVSVNTQEECCECDITEKEYNKKKGYEENLSTLHYNNGKTYCPDCRDPEDSDEEDSFGFTDCDDCGYSHNREDKCPNEATACHYEKWREDEVAP